MRPFRRPLFGATPIPVEEALALILGQVSLTPSERAGLPDADGRVLREDIRALSDVPDTDRSAMDGYALKSSQSAEALRILATERAAGAREAAWLRDGEAMRIMTGGAVPGGADCVAPFEIARITDDHLRLEQSVEPGANIRRRGEDMRSGSVVVHRGQVIGAGEIGAIATAGHASVVVGRRPRVAILATGDELVELGEAGAGGVVNSNSYALASLVRAHGGEPRILGIVPDRKEDTAAAIAATRGFDMVVSSGGVSVGAYDYVQDALDELRAETLFWRVAMKPGKPVLCARLEERLYFGLPGNPVSALVAFTLFVGPTLRKAAGQERGLLPPVVAIQTTAALKGAGDRRAYLRVRVAAKEGALLLEPMRAQGSAVTTSMVQANGLAIVEAGKPGYAAGEMVPTMLIGAILRAEPES